MNDSQITQALRLAKGFLFSLYDDPETGVALGYKVIEAIQADPVKAKTSFYDVLDTLVRDKILPEEFVNELVLNTDDNRICYKDYVLDIREEDKILC